MIGATTATPSGTFSFVYGNANFRIPGPCPAGHRCPIGSSYPIPCSVGTYQNQTGQSTCEDCPAGKYCDETGIATNTVLDAKLCAAGHYCQGATTVEKPIRTAHSGSSCASGKYCPTGTATEIVCPGGTYDKRKGISQCMTCPKGYYCPEGSTEPIVCPAGMFCVEGVAAGTNCPDGTYNTEDGLEETGQCRPCPVGKYCQNGAVVASCDSGYWCDSGAASATDPTKQCPINHYCESGTAAPVRCESGKINPVVGGSSPSNCTDCPAGYYCKETDEGLTTICPAGFYCPARSTEPSACSVGTFRATTEATSSADCIPCTAGALCNVEGVGNLLDFQCPVGKYCEAGVRVATDCPAGTYRNEVGAGSTADCWD